MNETTLLNWRYFVGVGNEKTGVLLHVAGNLAVRAAGQMLPDSLAKRSLISTPMAERTGLTGLTRFKSRRCGYRKMEYGIYSLHKNADLFL